MQRSSQRTERREASATRGPVVREDTGEDKVKIRIKIQRRVEERRRKTDDAEMALNAGSTRQKKLLLTDVVELHDNVGSDRVLDGDALFGLETGWLRVQVRSTRQVS